MSTTRKENEACIILVSTNAAYISEGSEVPVYDHTNYNSAHPSRSPRHRHPSLRVKAEFVMGPGRESQTERRQTLQHRANRT